VKLLKKPFSLCASLAIWRTASTVEERFRPAARRAIFVAGVLSFARLGAAWIQLTLEGKRDRKPRIPLGTSTS
jgi:hypothetical protein